LAEAGPVIHPAAALSAAEVAGQVPLDTASAEEVWVAAVDTEGEEAWVAEEVVTVGAGAEVIGKDGHNSIPPRRDYVVIEIQLT